MNEIPTEHGIAADQLKNPKAGNLWVSTIAFLKRAIKSFFPGGDKDGEFAEPRLIPLKDSVASAPLQMDMPIESLVDVSRLPDMEFKREVLDWRDNFHYNLMITLSSLHNSFAQYVQAELADTSLFRKLVSRKSDEVLQDSFIRLVRWPLITAIRKEDAKLNACAKKWGVFWNSDLVFDISALSHECASLQGITFKPSNKELILSCSQELILGPVGLAAVFRDQGLQLSKKLMDKKAT